MSNTKRTVKIKESELVDLIDNILSEAIKVKKEEWIREQAENETKKNSILESKINKLEKQFKEIMEKNK